MGLTNPQARGLQAFSVPAIDRSPGAPLPCVSGPFCLLNSQVMMAVTLLSPAQALPVQGSQTATNRPTSSGSSVGFYEGNTHMLDMLFPFASRILHINIHFCWE